jgi:hypothetical protein
VTLRRRGVSASLSPKRSCGWRRRVRRALTDRPRTRTARESNVDRLIPTAARRCVQPTASFAAVDPRAAEELFLDCVARRLRQHNREPRLALPQLRTAVSLRRLMRITCACRQAAGIVVTEPVANNGCSTVARPTRNHLTRTLDNPGPHRQFRLEISRRPSPGEPTTGQAEQRRHRRVTQLRTATAPNRDASLDLLRPLPSSSRTVPDLIAVTVIAASSARRGGRARRRAHA